MVVSIIILCVVGLIVGAVARLLVPGRDPIGVIGTIVLGIAGSFVGGFLEELIFNRHISIRHLHTAGFIGSIVGAIILLLLARATGLERGHRRRTRV